MSHHHYRAVLPRCSAIVDDSWGLCHDCRFNASTARCGMPVCGTHARVFDGWQARRNGSEDAARAAAVRRWFWPPPPLPWERLDSDEVVEEPTRAGAEPVDDGL